ncbi:MAG TPA: phosphatase PAP2 family protein [Gaiellaceae bacterium]|nr:phosphatase PAP2 family protein [Gaiellaceae bacterium]
MSGRAPLLAVTLACAAGFALTFLLALHTEPGLHDDAALYGSVSGNGLDALTRGGATVLRTIDSGTLALEVLLLAFLGLARGRAAQAAAAAAVVVLSIGSTELLKHGLPHLGGAVPAGRPATFPSGHTSVAVSVGLGLVIASPPVLRAVAAVAGAAYGAAIGLAVVLLGWHYPSDAVGSFFVCGFWAALAGVALGAAPGRAAVSARGLAVGATATAAGLVLAAALAARHALAVDAVRSRPWIVATGAAFGFLSVAVFAVLTPLLGERDLGSSAG